MYTHLMSVCEHLFTNEWQIISWKKKQKFRFWCGIDNVLIWIPLSFKWTVHAWKPYSLFELQQFCIVKDWCLVIESIWLQLLMLNVVWGNYLFLIFLKKKLKVYLKKLVSSCSPWAVLHLVWGSETYCVMNMQT